ncbi:hypothetical protein J3F83DRAFT_351574 [Trichoderma novae-zelandiae]
MALPMAGRPVIVSRWLPVWNAPCPAQPCFHHIIPESGAPNMAHSYAVRQPTCMRLLSSMHHESRRCGATTMYGMLAVASRQPVPAEFSPSKGGISQTRTCLRGGDVNAPHTTDRAGQRSRLGVKSETRQAGLLGKKKSSVGDRDEQKTRQRGRRRRPPRPYSGRSGVSWNCRSKHERTRLQQRVMSGPVHVHALPRRAGSPHQPGLVGRPLGRENVAQQKGRWQVTRCYNACTSFHLGAIEQLPKGPPFFPAGSVDFHPK